MKQLKILKTDQLFADSPDPGHPDCKCSRCGQPIMEEELPIRCWPTGEDGEVYSYEYRYCEKCYS